MTKNSHSTVVHRSPMVALSSENDRNNFQNNAQLQKKSWKEDVFHGCTFCTLHRILKLSF